MTTRSDVLDGGMERIDSSSCSAAHTQPWRAHEREIVCVWCARSDVGSDNTDLPQTIICNGESRKNDYGMKHCYLGFKIARPPCQCSSRFNGWHCYWNCDEPRQYGIHSWGCMEIVSRVQGQLFFVRWNQNEWILFRYGVNLFSFLKSFYEAGSYSDWK